MGGSFDPVHYGHLRVALEVSQKLGISCIKFLPCRQQVLKTHFHANTTHRLAMLALAIKGVPAFEIDESETQRNAPSYMAETLALLKQKHPHESLCLILGSDTVKSFEQWYHWQSIFDLAHLIIVTRPQYEITSIPWLRAALPMREVTHIEELMVAQAGKILVFPASLLAISAQEIRRQLANQESPKFLLPDTVLNYIQQHHLYERG